MAIGRTERCLYEAAISSAEATIEALKGIGHLAQDFAQGDPDSITPLVLQAQELRTAISEELSYAL